MEDVNISKYRAQVVRAGSTPASPGFAVSEGQNPVDPSGSGQTHLPVTIATAATGLSITESQVLGGAGTVGQYIRGDGSLADFPESSGGGSSVSYYLNGSVSQGTIGGVAYKEMNKVPILGAGTDFTINANGYIASFLTDAGDPNLLEIPGGNWNFETYFSANNGGGSPTFYVELYKYNGTTFTLLASNSAIPELIAFGTNITAYFTTLAVPTTTLALTDRLAVRYYVTHSGRTITMHTEGPHLCQIITTFTTGLTALNGLTAQIQNFAVGTSGTDFAIASATATHTFNLPTASATNRGALSSADWTTFNNKTSNLGTVTSVGLSSATSGVTIGSSPVTTSGTITLAIATASGSQNGLLSSTDWTTFNGKQNALTNPVTGTGTTNYLPKFTGASTIGNSLFTDNGTNAAYNNAGVAARTFIIQATSGRPLALEVIENANVHAIYFYPNNSGFNRISSDYMSGGTFLPLSLTGRENNADLVCQTNGNITIGTTTDNGARLQVSGTATVNGAANTTTFNVKASGANGILLDENAADSASSTRIFFKMNSQTYAMLADTNGLNFMTGAGAGSTSGTPRVTLTSTGNVGIGTANPDNKLSVWGSNNSLTSSQGNINVYTTDSVAIDTGGSIGLGGYYNTSNLFIPFANITGKKENSNNDNAAGYLAFLTRNNSAGTGERMRITSGGNVLIGTTTDAGFKLDVAGTGRFTGTITSEIIGPQNLILKSSAQFGGYVQFERSGTIFGYLGNAGSVTGSNTDDMALRSQNGLRFSTGGNNLRMTIDSSGNIGAPSGTNIYNASDLRLKRNISKISSGLDKITSLNPVKFNWLDGFVPSENGKEMLGFIAQEVFEIIPEAVESFGNNSITINNIEIKNPLRVNEKFIIPVLVKAIQELKQEIDTLKN